MQKETFTFNKASSIIIYGCSGNGIYYYRELRKRGYYVEFFVDSRAKEMGESVSIEQYKDIPVYCLEDVNSVDKINVVVFVAIRNSIEQNKVAELLHEAGYENIIYMPMVNETVKNEVYVKSLKRFYRNFIDCNFKNDLDLPKVGMILERELFQDNALIKRNGDIVVAWAPISIIYYYSIKQKNRMIESFGISNAKNTDEIYLDKSIFQVEYINQLFKFFLFGNNDLDIYLDFENKIENCVKKQSSLENQLWLEDRQKCMEIMENGTNRGVGYWIESAIPVEWNEKGFFNICDGAHRLAYLNCMNMNMVPIQTTIEDYDKWVNAEKNTSLINFCKEKGIVRFETPIVHPWYYGCEVNEEKVGKTVLKYLLEYLGSRGMDENFKVLDLNPHEGYYLQHFTRLGAKARGVVNDEKERELLWYVNELFNMNSKISILDINDMYEQEETYNIVFLMKKLSALLEKKEVAKMLKWINLHTAEMIVWESGIEPEIEKRLIVEHTDFKKYHFIKKTLSDKIIREVGFFTKNN